MKKLFCSIASLATAVLTFVFLSIPCMVVSGMGMSESSNAWDMLKDEAVDLTGKTIDGYTLFKIFTIVAIIVACILAILGVILLLQQFGIIKSEMNFRFISAILLAVYTVVAIIAMVGVIIMCNNDMFKLLGDAISVKVGVGMILNVVVGAIATVIGFLFCRNKK